MKKESRCVLLAIIFIGVVFEVLYFFKVYPEDGYIVTGGIAVLLFVSYFLLNSFYDLKREAEEQRAREQESMIKKLMEEMTVNRNNATLENVEKFEKAIYMALQNGTKAISDEIQVLDNHLSNGIEGIIQQIGETVERSAKINVKYSRENTKSLMVFQQKVFNNVIQGMEETVREVNQMAEKVNQQLEQMESAIKEISISAPTFSGNSVSSMIQTPQDISEQSLDEIAPQIEMEEELPAVEEVIMPEEVVSETDIILEPENELIVNDVEEPAEELEPVAIPEVNTDPNHVMTPEEIAALVAGGISEEPAEEPEPVAIPEVNTDPNHVMTPEEIAALVAGGISEEPAEEPEPVVTPEVNADPNHVMTPEEIAALIAGTK
ncbi:MAG: hypothetical protein HFJ09_01300 [Lachnospiraceae bacterium]|nr:hypothetical protein [Lachnospiraceae bacterium]